MDDQTFGGATEKIFATKQHRQAFFFARNLRAALGVLPRPLTKPERLMIRQRIRHVENSTAMSLSVRNFGLAPGPFKKPARMTGLLSDYATRGSKRAARTQSSDAVDKLRWQLQSLAKSIHRSAQDKPWTKKERADIRALLRDAQNDESLSLS